MKDVAVLVDLEKVQRVDLARLPARARAVADQFRHSEKNKWPRKRDDHQLPCDALPQDLRGGEGKVTPALQVERAFTTVSTGQT